MSSLISKYKIEEVLLFLAALTLPVNENINTWIFVALATYGIYLLAKNSPDKISLKKYTLYLIPSALIAIKLIGLINSTDISKGLEEVLRYCPFILIPFSIFITSQRTKRVNAFVFKGLTVGCIIAIFICWVNAIQAVIRNNEPLSNILGWKRSNTFLTRIIDIHPPYLGILIVIAIIYITKRYLIDKSSKRMQNRKKVLVYILLSIFILFLFHLVSRNSIILLFLVLFSWTTCYRQKKFIFISLIVIGISSLVIHMHPSDYLKRKYVKMLDPSNDELGDKRFSRLTASWSVFKEKPLFGAGADDDQLRVKEYKVLGDQVAFKKELNAHNQYVEYLANSGLIGVIIFLLVVIVMLRLTIKNKNYFYTALILCFLFSCLTESMLERELGIKTFSLILALSINKVLENKNVEASKH